MMLNWNASRYEQEIAIARQSNLNFLRIWGPTAVPVCESLPGANHLSVLTGLADPAGRLHGLALRLLGLA